MKFSYSWLTEHLKTNVHFEEIEKKLTSIGLEVEDIQDTGEAYQDFIVGQVLEEKKHPNADLSLIHICRCRRSTLCRSRWSPYH